MPASVTTIPAAWRTCRCSPRSSPVSTGMQMPDAVIGATRDNGALTIAR